LTIPIQIYKPYSELTLVDVLRYEFQAKSISTLLFSGIPTVLAYHISDWVGFIAVDVVFDDNGKGCTPTQAWFKYAGHIL
jgi:hypothetical protein